MASLPRLIAPGDRIPTFQKIMFSAGVNLDYFATSLMASVLWMPFFNIGLSLSPVTLGIMMMILRGWDAINDPIIGNLSDNTRTRWGRRRPYMFVASITTGGLILLFWFIPKGIHDESFWLVHIDDWLSHLIGYDLITPARALPVYITLVGMAFFTSFACWSMPYYGMQLELTPNYDERTRLTAWMTLFGKISSLAGSWILALVLLVGSLALNDPAALEGKPAFVQNILSSVQPWLAQLTGSEPGEKPVVVGMRAVCWLLAIGVVVFGMLPALFVKERYYQVEAAKQKKDPFWQSIRESATCKPLWSLILVSFFLVLGSSSVGSLGQYLNFYYVFGGDLAKASIVGGLKGTVIVVAGIASIPLFTWLGEKFDKRSMVMAMLGSSMFGHMLNYFLMTPEYPYLQLIPGVFESSAIAAVWLFIPSMKADVADWDERRTNRRREGSINSFFSWFIKASLTASVGIGGYVLHSSGFDSALSHQPHEVLMRMMHLYLVLPILIWSVALVAAWYYPLNRQRSADIRAELEARRGTV